MFSVDNFIQKYISPLIIISAVFWGFVWVLVLTVFSGCANYTAILVLCVGSILFCCIWNYHKEHSLKKIGVSLAVGSYLAAQPVLIYDGFVLLVMFEIYYILPRLS